MSDIAVEIAVRHRKQPEAMPEPLGDVCGCCGQSWECDAVKAAAKIRRYEDGLRRLRSQDYDAGYDPEAYADAILGGVEPNMEARLP